jgi:hypothetical protein
MRKWATVGKIATLFAELAGLVPLEWCMDPSSCARRGRRGRRGRRQGMLKFAFRFIAALAAVSTLSASWTRPFVIVRVAQMAHPAYNEFRM